jgi:PhzF family phenazine biosynthesis protein
MRLVVLLISMIRSSPRTGTGSARIQQSRRIHKKVGGKMNVLKLAAFSHNGQGGNPAGVAFFDEMPSDEEMLSVAKEVGYSETAFLVKQGEDWRVRYFAPELEVPFCGHATIALGAVLGERFGEGEYKLILNDSEITVCAEQFEQGMVATLHSPRTSSVDASVDTVDKVLDGFNLTRDDLDPAFPVRVANAGAKHMILVLKDRKTLADMKYDFDVVRALMMEQGLITVSLLWQESDNVFHSRNAFASGGVYEDPATGAAAAALAGYLRDIGWKGNRSFTILQGEDMGSPSRLLVKYDPEIGSSVAVSGEIRLINN